MIATTRRKRVQGYARHGRTIRQSGIVSQFTHPRHPTTGGPPRSPTRLCGRSDLKTGSRRPICHPLAQRLEQLTLYLVAAILQVEYLPLALFKFGNRVALAASQQFDLLVLRENLVGLVMTDLDIVTVGLVAVDDEVGDAVSAPLAVK